MSFTIQAHELLSQDQVVLEGIDDSLMVDQGIEDFGAFLRATAQESHSRHVFAAGCVSGLVRYTACHRYEPYWMKPFAGHSLSELPPETQSFLGERDDGSWVLLVPLVGELFRFSLRAARGGHSPDDKSRDALELLAETADPLTPGYGGLALFVAVGPEPFELLRRSAEVVCARLCWGRLRRDKPLPDFADYLGFCTWDAFYHEVSYDKVREALSSFAAGGVSPRWMILDDGWQSVRKMPTGETRLVGFAANDKFPGGLSATVRLAKETYGIRWFLVWHALLGYWGGVDGASLPQFEVKPAARRFGEGVLAHRASSNEQWWGGLVGLLDMGSAERFFLEYHGALRNEGVDGVKVDSEAVLEGLAFGQGGRAPLYRAFGAALEASASATFGSRLIHCMANAQESWYGGKTTTLLRSSMDFLPSSSRAHGEHLYTNCQVGAWFGHFMHPDWDMFQTAHEWGEFHAAARAVSGGLVYTSDQPGQHDVALLKKLSLSDGRVLRCDQPGQPTRDVLCVDPTREKVLLKIWNRNGPAGFVGAFHARNVEHAEDPIAGTVRASDVPGLSGERFACFRHQTHELLEVTPFDPLEVTLGPREFELFTFVPLEEDIAVIGLSDKFNSAGAVRRVSGSNGKERTVELLDGGSLVVFCRDRPRSVACRGDELSWTYDACRFQLTANVPTGAERVVRIGW